MTALTWLVAIPSLRDLIPCAPRRSNPSTSHQINAVRRTTRTVPFISCAGQPPSAAFRERRSEISSAPNLNTVHLSNGAFCGAE